VRQVCPSSDRIESDPRSLGAARVEVVSKTDIPSIFPAKSEKSISSRLSTNSSRSLCWAAAGAEGSLVSARWLLKPPEPLATHIQELKTKVVPSSSTVLVKSKDAIEFSGGCSMNTPTWRAICRCLTSKPTEVVDCRWGVAKIRNSKVQGTQDLDRFKLQYA
jgi:hypothetical protein